MIKPHFELMANYNAIMNQKISDSLPGVSEDTLWADKKHFWFDTRHIKPSNGRRFNLAGAF